MIENEKLMDGKMDDPDPKAPYRTPRFEVYGDILEITLGGRRPDNEDQKKYQKRSGYSDPNKDQRHSSRRR